jgi:hypothetical protein
MENTSQRAEAGRPKWLLPLAALLLVIAAILGFRLNNGGWNGGAGNESVITLPLFQQAVEAVAATEEADFQRASTLWQQLIAAQPTNPIYKLNQAITLQKRIEVIEGRISSGKESPEEVEQLRADLEDAYQQVETVVSSLETSETDYRPAFVKAALLAMKADKAGADTGLRKQAVDVLAEQLKHNPGELLLAAKFDELASQLEFDYPELSQARTDVLYDAYVKNPRNLFILKSAGEALLREKDSRLAEVVGPSLDLVRPMMKEPLVARNAERLKLDELLPKVEQSIAAGDWATARGLTPWLNILLSSSGFIADGKLAKPDVLALLETSFLGKLAAELDVAVTELGPLPEYDVAELSSSATVAAWYDFDFDLDFDIVLASGTSLRVHELVDGKPTTEAKAELELGFAVGGILPIDMFEVELPTRPKTPGTVAELMQDGNQPQELTPEQLARAQRHNTLQELLLWGEMGMRVVTLDDSDAWVLLDTPTGLEDYTQVSKVVPIDFESDGDLDLAVINAGQLLLLQNSGNRTFQDISEYSTLPAACRDLIACDFDHDTDQDFLLLDPTQTQVILFENLLHSQFRATPLVGELWQTVPNAVSLSVADIDGNNSWDVITSNATQSKLTYTSSLSNFTVAARSAVELPIGGAAISLEDLNNDGGLDLILASGSGVQVAGASMTYENLGIREQAQLVAFADKSLSSCSVLDCNGDGMPDILAVADGVVGVCMPREKTDGRYLLVRVAGINDGNGGGRINHYCVGAKLEVWAQGQHFSSAVRNPVTHIGLGDKQPDNLRIVFPNGITQNVEKPTPQTLIEEKQIPRGSCPYAYGWDGEKFVMLTDLLWNAPLGLQIARGKVLPDRRWEYLLLPGEWMQPREGRIDLRVTEELWEIAYFDHIQLTAIDHPADVRVFTNEKVGPPAIAEHQVFAVQQRIEPIAASDSYGRDVLSRIRIKDNVVVQAFERQICQGLCEPHFVELDFGKLPVDEQHLRLFLTGWMYPTDTSLNIGIDQNPARNLPEPPSLWVVDEEGEWVCAQPFMGFPGGKTKSIVIDLGGVFRSEDHRLRIGASQQIYWDEAFVSWHAGDAMIRQQPLQLSAANLHYRGFSELIPRKSDQPHWFDYQQASEAANWPTLAGPFTRFGDVREILADDDDRMVVMVSGDEILLNFEPPAQNLPEGWKRDFVMHSTGWDKDADSNTVEGQGSLPLPFMSQVAYPAPPEQTALAKEVWLKNAGSLTRQQQFGSEPQPNF